MADIALKVEGLERWRDGNGKPGAAAMLADHEKRIVKAECDTEAHDKVLRDIELHHATEKTMIVAAISEAMARRGKSREGMVRAFGPYVAAISAVIIAL